MMDEPSTPVSRQIQRELKFAGQSDVIVDSGRKYSQEAQDTESTASDIQSSRRIRLPLRGGRANNNIGLVDASSYSTEEYHTADELSGPKVRTDSPDSTASTKEYRIIASAHANRPTTARSVGHTFRRRSVIRPWNPGFDGEFFMYEEYSRKDYPVAVEVVEKVNLFRDSDNEVKWKTGINLEAAQAVDQVDDEDVDEEVEDLKKLFPSVYEEFYPGRG